ncbi:hypothetical protein AAP_03355 [Ascosphaera apis ARSEF 7405]|uniref:Uncharacterized protein n=1 Tax=Ascosphaera apis ARSEF 7405 TaxID=392613 RepID=A0A167YQV2_9EURO|nr:hypothetical protein AAP_03355 [Ascosphaera apis ARSEF 7405]
MSPLAVRATASAPYGQVSGSGAQNVYAHEKPVVDAAVAAAISTDAGTGASPFRADEHHHTSFENHDCLVDRHHRRRRYRYNVTSLSCPSSPSPLVLQHFHAERAAGGDHISGSFPSHAFTQSEESFAGEHNSIGLAYNMTPPAPMSAFRSPTPSEGLGLGHKRKGSALKTVMKRLFNRRRQGSDVGRDDEDEEMTEDDGYHGHLGDVSFIRTRGTSPYPAPSRTGFRSEPSRRAAAPSPAAVTNDMSSRGTRQPAENVGVAMSNEEEEDNTSKRALYIKRPRAGRRRTASSAPISEMDSSSTSIIDTEYMLNVDFSGSSSQDSPAQSLGVWREEERKATPDLCPRSVSAAAIREAARHVRRASEDVPISRIDARDVSPFPLLPQQETVENDAPVTGNDQPAETFDPDESHRVSSLQSFNFGTFQRDDAGNLGQRVATIEVKLMDLELAISRLQVNASTKQSAPHRPPPPPPVQAPRAVESPRISDNFLSKHPHDPQFVPPTPASFGSPQSSPIESTRSTTPLDRFLNDNTNSMTFSPDFLSSGFDARSPSAADDRIFSMTSEQYNGIMDMMRREQESRRALEKQVAALQRQLSSLSSLQ